MSNSLGNANNANISKNENNQSSKNQVKNTKYYPVVMMPEVVSESQNSGLMLPNATVVTDTEQHCYYVPYYMPHMSQPSPLLSQQQVLSPPPNYYHIQHHQQQNNKHYNTSNILMQEQVEPNQKNFIPVKIQPLLHQPILPTYPVHFVYQPQLHLRNRTNSFDADDNIRYITIPIQQQQKYSLNNDSRQTQQPMLDYQKQYYENQMGGDYLVRSIRAPNEKTGNLIFSIVKVRFLFISHISWLG